MQLLCSTEGDLMLQRRLKHLAGDFCCYHPTYMEAHGVRKEQPYHITPRNESTLAILQVGVRLCCVGLSRLTESRVRKTQCLLRSGNAKQL